MYYSSCKSLLGYAAAQPTSPSAGASGPSGAAGSAPVYGESFSSSSGGTGSSKGDGEAPGGLGGFYLLLDEAADARAGGGAFDRERETTGPGPSSFASAVPASAAQGGTQNGASVGAAAAGSYFTGGTGPSLASASASTKVSSSSDWR